MSCEIPQISKHTYIRKSEGKRGGSDKYEKNRNCSTFLLINYQAFKLIFFEDKHINCQIYRFSKNLASMFL